MKILKQNIDKIIVLLFLLLMMYTMSQTFLTSDDLAYSFMRTAFTKTKYIRITTLNQIIKDNIYGYYMWTGRFITHCIVEFLLIFEKNIWAIFNSAILTIYVVILSSIEKRIGKKKEYTILLLVNITLLLSMSELKYLLYWVAGSVNYIWPLTLILYYTYKNLEDEEYENYALLLLISILQELSLTYIFIFIIIKIYKKYKKTKKIDLTPLIPIVLGGIILLAAPGNFKRLSTLQTDNGIIKYINSLRTTLKLVLNIKQPVVILYLIINFTKQKNKLFYLSIFLLAQFESFFYILIIYLSIKPAINKTMALSFYGTMIFMALIPSYEGIHPYIYIYTYMIIENSISILTIKKQKIILIMFMISTMIYGTIEYKTYKDIGKIKQQRIENIENAKVNNKSIIELKKIKNEKKLIDANANDDALNTRKYIIKYYDLNENIKIEFID